MCTDCKNRVFVTVTMNKLLSSLAFDLEDFKH